ncbi:hypothetical protein DLJ46_28445 [Micromonospora globispora]|uniref:Uncharacterized protein n=1 Tax=Micromonospora globispora TaxID=1450148 RepID=A0A317JY18_9ACTN|nr:hypothetical protein [Micromonospora globispora]PWU43983.1 hypothetical protein DLJ46_28445 [Micromonospora globispora]RQX08095.1 hypothetical protein DKL51_00275 [Micromonospora globispora]
MYAWIWRKLPYGLAGKITGSVLLAVAAVALLWIVVFPWAEPLLPFDDVQVTQDSGVPADGPGGLTVPSATPSHEEIPYDTETNNTPPSTPSR